jgi:hypothetical protein
MRLRQALVVLWPVVCSLVCSFLVFYFFVPSVREAQLRLGSLLADGIREIDSIGHRQSDRWRVSLENRGPLPLSNVRVMFRGKKLGVASIDVAPPIPYKKESPESNTLNIWFAPPLAAGAHVDLQLSFPRVLNRQSATQSDKIEVVGPKGSRTYNFTLRVEDSSAISAWAVADGTSTTAAPWRFESSEEQKSQNSQRIESDK